jgi:biotin carboxylase
MGPGIPDAGSAMGRRDSRTGLGQLSGERVSVRALILSTTTGYQLRSFGDAAERAGIDLMFATDRCHRIDDPWRDAAVAVRFHEQDASLRAIVAAARTAPVDGVVAVGDRPVVLAARAAEALGLRGNPPAAAAAAINKKLSREAFTRAGLAVPWFFETGAPAAQLVDDPRISYPCVVKPLGLSGSRGVIRADTPEALQAAVARVRTLLARKDVRALRSGLDDNILIEGFIRGREYAIEGVLTAGAFRCFAIFDKPVPLDGPFFEETIYVTPSHLSAPAQQLVVEHVSRAARALGLLNGPVHAECRMGADGVFLLEVAPRPIGGLCSRVLRFTRAPAPDEVTLEDVLLRHAVGQDISSYVREPCAAGVMMIPIPRRGTLRRVSGIERAAATSGIEDVRITAKTDQLLEPLPEAASYLGFIFARGTDPQSVSDALNGAHAQLEFEIAAPIPVTTK